MPVSLFLRHCLTFFFNLFTGKKEFSTAGSDELGSAQKKVIVLSPGSIPTTDIYLKGMLEKTYSEKVQYLNTLHDLPVSIFPDAKTVLIVVRYAPVRWLRWLASYRAKVAGIILMVDDDLPVVLQASELPLKYAIKTAWRYALTKRFLGNRCREIWVSTPALARRYTTCSTRVQTPKFVLPYQADQPRPVYFYHGTWAHKREIQWLVPIVREVQQLDKCAWFEIMGNNTVRRLFAGIPRVRIVFPMSWPDYLDYSAGCRYQIGLAPCLKSDFNSGRSHSKIFDISRLGAAGVYSDAVPYRGAVLHGKTGLLCKNDGDSWIAAILLLLRERSLRNEIAENALSWCEERAIRL